MYDLHNHLLPGVDDGARNLTVALRMLEIALKQGITHVACTPHANDRLDDKQDRLHQSVLLFVKNAAKERGLPIELTLGTELMVGSNLLKVLSHSSATYGGAGMYCLIEFATETPFEIIQNVVTAVRRRNLYPVLAHYERFGRALAKPEQPQALRQAGAVLTLDAGSLVGQFGSMAQKRAKQLLQWGAIDILASDAHDDEGHGFQLKPGYDAAAALVGVDKATRMVKDNPRRIWEGRPWPIENSVGVSS